MAVGGPMRIEDVLRIDNGGTFVTGDLHIHSFGGSHDVKDQTMTPQAIIDTAVTLGLSVLSITDHNTDANVLPALQYAQRAYSGKLLLLPGVEITTAHGHLLVYFNPEQATNVRDLLVRVGVVGAWGSKESHTTRSMADVISEAERLGGLCIAAHIDRVKTGFEALQAGYPNWKKDILKSVGLYGLELDDAKHLGWYSTGDEPTNEGGQRKQLVTLRQQVAALAARATLAPVTNSDAHDLAGFKSRVAARGLTRYKMNELTFDSFRTALIDPTARVRVLASIPRSFSRIIGMQVTGGFLDGEAHRFSDNLTCVIGGRGTGKSTALRAISYALGKDNPFDEHTNRPASVVLWAEDENGVAYRYERTGDNPPVVRAKDDQSTRNVPPDAFSVEYYAQGALAEIAKDPLKNPALLQVFLDRQIRAEDLFADDRDLRASLASNAKQLTPLELEATQLEGKKRTLADLNKKIELAETGKIRELAALQSQLTAEQTLRTLLGNAEAQFVKGLSLAPWQPDFAALAASAGSLTKDPASVSALAAARDVVQRASAFVASHEKAVNEGMKAFADELRKALQPLDAAHVRIGQEVSGKAQDLKKKGLASSIAELETHLTQRTKATKEVAAIEARALKLTELRQERSDLLARLKTSRDELIRRRKAVLPQINGSLAETIPEYKIFLSYDPAGLIEEFRTFVGQAMAGSYFQDEAIDLLCRSLGPGDLLAHVRGGRGEDIARAAGVTPQKWGSTLLQRLSQPAVLYGLELVEKAPCPVINVMTRGNPQRSIPITQMSDGQKHTILLIISMHGDSAKPLIIDQPEDDLDNEFISTTLVATLRAVKERRQVIVVTHNANIAVLGDSELILPMRRTGDQGAASSRGSIDKAETKQAVQSILEGGKLAFQRRREIYAY